MSSKGSINQKKITLRKSLLGFILGLVLAIIVLNVDRNLWQPLELETINGRNTSSWFNKDKLNSKNIVVVLFDDKTQFLLRQNGMPIKDFEKRGRDLIASAIEKLESYDTKAIGINLNLNNPSFTEADERLAKTISSFKNIVIAGSIQSYLPYSPTSILRNTKGIGYGELYADYDRVVHKINLIDKNHKKMESFSYVLYKTSQKRDVENSLKDKNEFYLKYPRNACIKYSFLDLINEKINSEDLKNKIVILGIGLKSKLIENELLNPFDKKSYISDSEVQAVALANFMNKSYLSKISIINNPVLFVLVSMLLGVVFSSMTPFRSLIFGTLTFTSLIISSQIAYEYYQTIIELVPLLFLILGNLVIGLLIFLQLNLQEQNIELEEVLKMLRKRGSELENSKLLLQNKNTELTSAFTKLNEKVQELREVRKQLSNRSEDERKRIARELHDDTLARITDLRRLIESILNSPDVQVQTKKDLGVSIQTLDNVTYEMRRIINALRPSMLDNVLGLVPAIESLLDDLRKRSNYKIQTKLNTKITKLEISEATEINLYRIIQEALNNILKHSNATKVEIVIEKQPGQVLILVNDNGIGLNGIGGKIINKKGFGFIDMKERAELLGGSAQYLNKPSGTGATLEITVPGSGRTNNENILENEKGKTKVIAI